MRGLRWDVHRALGDRSAAASTTGGQTDAHDGRCGTVSPSADLLIVTLRVSHRLGWGTLSVILRSVLLLDVCAYGFNPRFSRGATIIAAAPEVAVPQVSAQMVAVVAHEDAAGYAFEAVDERGELDCGGECHQQVHVVLSAVEFFKRAAEFVAYGSHGDFAIPEYVVSEYFVSVFRYEHQMYMTVPNSMPSLTYFIVFTHDTKYNVRCWEVNCMAINETALAERNKRIGQSGRETRRRREQQVCRTFTCKIDYRKLKPEQRSALSGIFLDAKRLYNDCVTSDDVFSYHPTRSVRIRMKDGRVEVRTLDHIGVQTMQGIVQRARSNVRSLAALKRAGHKVGRLKPVRRFDSIPLKQPERTFKLRGGYIHVERIPGMIRLNGVKQLEGWEIGPAKLTRKASGYYMAFACFKDRDEYESSRPAKPTPPNPIGGMDAGLKDEIAESDGVKTSRRYPETRKARYWQRRMSKRVRNSRGWHEANRQYRREQERLAARRKHAAIKESQRLCRKYATLVIQDEQIHSWNRSKGRMRGGRKIHAGILGRLYSILRQQPNVIVLDKWQPTTSWCRQCGRRTPCPPSRRTFVCAYCGAREDRDQHAGLNMTVLCTEPLKRIDLRKPRDIPIGPYLGSRPTDC